MDDHLTPSLKDLSSDALEERLKVFASVQYDPELWELVQEKFHRFEDLHTQMEEQQLRRRDLLKELSEVNESISGLQDQLIVLSGKEKISQEMAELNTRAEQFASEPAKEERSFVDEPPAVEAAEPEDEPVVGLSPIEDEEEVKVAEQPVEEPAHQAVGHDGVVPWQPSEELPPVSEVPSVAPDAEVEAAVENIEAYQPIADLPVDPIPVVASEPVAPAPEPVVESIAPEVSEPIPAPAQPALDIPSEVSELQKLYDQADAEIRQSDSALKLVQLYDGKAETFFTAMVRSHQQGGLAVPEASQEATKDVQTMIATAKSSVGKSGDKKGGVKRLFGSK